MGDSRGTILLVEDDRFVRVTVRDALEDAGYRVTACCDGSEGLRALESAEYDLLLSDVRLPGADGFEVFKRGRALRPDLAVVLMTAYADFNDAVAAIRTGARDYVVKPFEVDQLLARIERIRAEQELERSFKGKPGETPRRLELFRRYPSGASQRLAARLQAAAASDFNVLICGETGTGKDLCAQLIHAGSSRAERPFVAVNCAALPENLLEAELFGHEKGAFTGAESRRSGRFEAANGGTLFLDEIGELPLQHQVKLLRALETSSFEPLGSSRSIKVDVRIVAATNKNLEDAAQNGSFRKDLYYRLNVIDVQAPSLRDRRADVPLLVSEFLSEIAARQGIAVPVIDSCAAAAFATYDYPGNVRELKHAIERSFALSGGDTIRCEHLPPALAAFCRPDCTQRDAPQPGVTPLETAVENFERQYIKGVLSSVDGKRGEAAALLGISRKSLWQKLRGR